MKTADKLKLEQEKELEERINIKVQKLKTRKAYNYFLSNLTYPETEKELKKTQVIKYVELFETKLPAIKSLIKSIKKNYIPHIWEQDPITAVYLLTAKTYQNLETMIMLAKKGRNFEIVDLARSGHESLDLAFLFLELGQEERLGKWFKGKIIKNKVAREALHKTINSEKHDSTNLPMYELKTHIYSIYSLYTHSSYGAIFDSIDVFHEDFDYNGISGFHYTLRNLDITIKNLAISILLEIKNIFTKFSNLEGIHEADRLLEELGNKKVSEEEIKQILDRYQKD